MLLAATGQVLIAAAARRDLPRSHKAAAVTGIKARRPGLDPESVQQHVNAVQPGVRPDSSSRHGA